MSFEMSCASCEGRLMVETLGIVVACPHCGTHLAIPAEIPGLAETPAPNLEMENLASEELEDSEDTGAPDPSIGKSTWVPDVPGEESVSAFPDFSASANEAAASESNVLVSEPVLKNESEVPSAIRVANPDPSAVMPAIITDATVSEPISGIPVIGDSPPEPAPQLQEEPAPEVEPPALVQDAEPIVVAETKPSEPAPIISETAETVGSFPVLNVDTSGGHSDSAPMIVTDQEHPQAEFPDFAAASPTPAIVETAQPQAAPVSQESEPTPPPGKTDAKEKKQQSVYDSVFNSRRGRLIPPPVFQAWLSYTILLTGGLAMAIYYIFTTPNREMENLPDVKPIVDKSGKIVCRLVPEKAKMPPGHTLSLNETQRFGNLEVTPLKVTKGDLTLVGREYGSSSRQVKQEGTVLKLWLKFKNVSQDQTIAPIDNELLFYRNPHPERNNGAVANNFVCRANEKSKPENLVLVYDHWFVGDYNIKEANIGHELKPGEEAVLCIPSETTGWKKLKGDLIWRVHFRKGYSPKHYGITTIFEVDFNSDAIQADSHV